MSERRTISLAVYVQMTPTKPAEVGETDVAMEIGRGLIEESMRVLQEAARREGFEVRIHVGQMVY